MHGRAKTTFSPEPDRNRLGVLSGSRKVLGKSSYEKVLP